MTDTILPNPQNTLDATIRAARLADPVVKHDGGRTHVFVPNDFMLEDITDPHTPPPYIKQSISLSDRSSFIAYINRFKDERTILVADYDSLSINGYLDYHNASEPSDPTLEALDPMPVTHRARFSIKESLEYARWSLMEGAMHSQQDFALFIEENVFDIVHPDHAEIIEICRDLEATQGAQFKSRTRLENGDLSFKYESETRITNDVVVPEEIRLSIPLFYGEEPTEIRAKFRFRVSDGGLKLGFKWHRVEYQRQDKFHEMAMEASNETACDLFMGSI